jgi:hypothetical protein
VVFPQVPFDHLDHHVQVRLGARLSLRIFDTLSTTCPTIEEPARSKMRRAARVRLHEKPLVISGG